MYSRDQLLYLIDTYEKRLAEETRTEAKSFLRETLYNFRKLLNNE